MTALSILDLVRVTEEQPRRARRARQRPRHCGACRGLAIATSGWRNITTCPASPAPRRRSLIGLRSQTGEQRPSGSARHERSSLRPCALRHCGADRDAGGDCIREPALTFGLGRPPGTDQITLRALRRPPEAAENFPQDRSRGAGFPGPCRSNSAHPGGAGRGNGSAVVDFGLELFLARCWRLNWNLPYAFASHFAPKLLIQRCRSTATASNRRSARPALDRPGRRQHHRRQQR